jgi:UPF0755 protein
MLSTSVFCSRARRSARAYAALGASAAALSLAAGCGGGSGGTVARIAIPAGSSFRAAAESLASAKVIRSPTLFRVYASARGEDRAIKPGTYTFRRGASWNSVLATLTTGGARLGSVTIPEGYDLRQIVPALAKALNVPADSIEAAVRDTALLRRLDVPTATLEGYLYPETYSFTPGTTARDAVGQMVALFERRWRPEWDAQLRTLAMTRHDAITLASIVEKEARRGEERPVISAVYHNRLKRRMPLQADPTVQYARGSHTARVLYKDLEIDSPYNTYRRPGLPPGPIASPGSPSIAAALFPANVPYLYFVAAPDGHHEFRTTFEEHTRARGELRRAAGAARAPRDR